MRILAITNLYPNHQQPHRASFNRQQFAALNRGHEVRIIAPVAWTSRLRLGQVRPLNEGPAAVHPTYVYPPRILRGVYGPSFERSIRDEFASSLRSFRPDVVLGAWAYPDGWAAARLAREAGVPVAIKLHGSDILTLSGPTTARFRRTREAITGADAIIAVGRHVADRAIAMGAPADRVHIVPNGLDTSLFRPGPRHESRSLLGLPIDLPLILFVGNLQHVKGADVLMDALSLLRGRPFHAAFIGDGPCRGTLTHQAAALGLTGCLSFLGPRPQRELASWYRAADLLVLPSRSEGLPNVLLEAAACGTPFVASRVGGIPEIAPESSLVPPEDPGSLAERIERFLNPAHRPDPTPARRVSWDDSASALASVLGSIASAPAQRQAA